MADLAEFDRYMAYLCEGLGNWMRHQSLLEYCSGLMLPIQRKSVEPLAAHADPLNVPAKHQALHHFVANARWSGSGAAGAHSTIRRAALGTGARRLWVE